jgi:16S rRNA (cytosine967-C5)-methyltransferase
MRASLMVMESKPLKNSFLSRNFIKFDIGLLERIHPFYINIEKFISSLKTPPRFLYIRINTIKVNIEAYKKILKEKGIDFIEDPDIPEAVGFEVKGPNILNDIKNIKKVIADKKASESVMLGSDLFAPGIVSAKGVKKGDRVLVLSPNGVPVAEGVALMSEEEILKLRRGLAIKVIKSLYTTVKFSELPGAYEGLFYAQSLPSMVSVRMLKPSPGEVIVDLTAAPGGKVSHVAQLVGRSAKIIAVDRKSKERKLKENLRKLGVDWVEVISGDSRYLDKIFPNLIGKVDKVIIDPPCTNLGVRPKIFDFKTFKDVINSMLYQRAFIRTAKRLLKKGGRVLYSTCTLTWEENELNVEYAEELGFKVIEPPKWVRRRWTFNGKGVRFCPVKDDMPGFFATIMELD